jgi:hypothetical protein
MLLCDIYAEKDDKRFFEVLSPVLVKALQNLNPVEQADIQNRMIATSMRRIESDYKELNNLSSEVTMQAFVKELLSGFFINKS